MNRATTVKPVLVAWSGGKDSALALREIVGDARYRVAALLTTVTAEYDRISMHGVRRSLLHRQAESLGLPLEEVVISPGATNDDYETNMGGALATLRTRISGLDTVVFGDLFLADIRAYRERMLARLGLRGLFPLWLRDTRSLAHEFVRLGYRAVLVCVDATQLAGEFAGREFDADLLRDLPPDVDPCGENGEFHTFVYAGPGLREPVSHERGPLVVRDGRFVYCDLVETASR
ncbi:MAG: ATP-binding protein [Gemmatimonadetes bacterium]|nr:MAG: ATP-binding protein [Gemmatimonadota bacterium]PYP80523.1 MAG: ATP-binding protein [Gemmatimonadota bacterium]